MHHDFEVMPLWARSRRSSGDDNDIMATLNIRSLPASTRASLRVHAAHHGRSMEAEAREIIVRACQVEARTTSAADLQHFVDQMYATRPTHVVDDFIAERRKAAESE